MSADFTNPFNIGTIFNQKYNKIKYTVIIILIIIIIETRSGEHHADCLFYLLCLEM